VSDEVIMSLRASSFSDGEDIDLPPSLSSGQSSSALTSRSRLSFRMGGGGSGNISTPEKHSVTDSSYSSDPPSDTPSRQQIRQMSTHSSEDVYPISSKRSSKASSRKSGRRNLGELGNASASAGTGAGTGSRFAESSRLNSASKSPRNYNATDTATDAKLWSGGSGSGSGGNSARSSFKAASGAGVGAGIGSEKEKAFDIDSSSDSESGSEDWADPEGVLSDANHDFRFERENNAAPISSMMDSVRTLLGIPVYRNLLAAMAALYFTVTGVQYWGTAYILVTMKAPLPLVNSLFIVCAATGPTSGVFAGGATVDFFGGYKGAMQRVIALRICACFGEYSNLYCSSVCSYYCLFCCF
jgi:hypothetical protein